jgi:hypothetical protein
MTKPPAQLDSEIAEALSAEPLRYYRVTMHRNVEVMGPRRFWLRVIRDSPKVVIGWELDQDGERSHRKHIIERALATFEPARMNRTYATMEVIS